MSHKVLVMSPLHNMGASAVSELIAHGITFNNKNSMLLFTNDVSLHPHYLGITDIDDPTRSIMQVVKLIEADAMNKGDILDYAFTFAKNAYVMNVVDTALTARDRINVTQHMFDYAPVDVVVCDNNADLDDPSTEALLSSADMVFIVIDMSMKSVKHLKAWLDSKILKSYPNIYVVINRYSEVVSSVRATAKLLGIPANRVCKIHYNPWIEKCCNTSQMATLLPLAREFDPRVANIDNDIKEINQAISASIILKSKKGF